MLKKKEVEDHARTCLMKPKFCEYCELNVPAKDFNVHFKQCESRTTQCTLCEKAIVNKEYAIHTATCKGKSKLAPINAQQQLKKFEFADSLNEFWQVNERDKPKRPTKGNQK